MTVVSLVKRKAKAAAAEHYRCAMRLRSFVRREVPDDVDGFGVVAFRHGKGGELTIWADWSVRNTPDQFALPYLAAEKLSESIAGGSEDVDG